MKFKKIDIYNIPTSISPRTFEKTKEQKEVEEYISLCRMTADMNPKLGGVDYLLQSEFESNERYERRAKFVNVGYFIKKNLSIIVSAILKKEILVVSDNDKAISIAKTPNNNDTLSSFSRKIINELLISDICYVFTSSIGTAPTNATEQETADYRGISNILNRESVLDHLTITNDAGDILQMCIKSIHYMDNEDDPLLLDEVEQYVFYIKNGNMTKEITYRDGDDGLMLVDDLTRDIDIFPIEYIGDGGIPIIYDIAIAQINWMRRNSGNFSYVDSLSNPLGVGYGLNQALIDTIKQTGECSRYKEGTPEWYKCAKSKFTGKSFISQNKDEVDFKYVELDGSNYGMQDKNLKDIEEYIEKGFTRIVSTPRANKSAEESANESSEGVNFYESIAIDTERILNSVTRKNLDIAGIRDELSVYINKKFVDKPIDKNIVEVADRLIDRGQINQKGYREMMKHAGAMDGISEDGFVQLDAVI